MSEHPCGDEVSSLVQAARDHAATMRKLADVEAQRDTANERLAAVEAVCAEWALRGDAGSDFPDFVESVEHPSGARRFASNLARALSDPA